MDKTLPGTVDEIAAHQVLQRSVQDARAGQRLLREDVSVGSVVFVRAAATPVRRKLTPRFAGPYRVTRRTDQGLYVLESIAGQRLKRPYQLNQLKLVPTAAADRVWAAARGDRVYSVDHIVDHRMATDGSRQYLLRWQDFDEEFDSWESESAILDPSLLDEYWRLAVPVQDGATVHVPQAVADEE